MEASKWLDIQALLSTEEMEKLFAHLQPFQIFLTGTVTPLGQGEISSHAFLQGYRSYVDAIRSGQIPDMAHYRALFSTVFTLSPDHLNVLQVGNDRQLMRVMKPVVQLQPHSMGYSEYDGKFHSKVYGESCINWGIQFSYPQLFSEPQTKEILKVVESPDFPNTALFKALQRWMREHTVPTPMQTPTGPLNLPVRLGKECLPWINNHPQLKSKNLQCRT